MKYLFCILFLFFLCSCAFERERDLMNHNSINNLQREDSVAIRLDAGTSFSASTGLAEFAEVGDNVVEKLNIYIFNDSKKLEYRREITDQFGQISIMTKPGKKVIFVVANSNLKNSRNQEFSSLTDAQITLDEMLKAYVDIPEPGPMPPLPMCGVALTEIRGGELIPILLEHCCAKFSLKGSFMDKFEQDNDLVISKCVISLKNISKRCAITDIQSVNFNSSPMEFVRVKSNLNANKGYFSNFYKGAEYNIDRNSYCQEFYYPSFIPYENASGEIDYQKGIPWLSLEVTVVPSIVYGKNGSTSVPTGPTALLAMVNGKFVKKTNGKPKFFASWSYATEQGSLMDYSMGTFFYRIDLGNGISQNKVAKYTINRNTYYKISIDNMSSLDFNTPALRKEMNHEGWSKPTNTSPVFNWEPWNSLNINFSVNNSILE